MPDVLVQQSGIEGLGLFARRRFGVGDRIHKIDVIREVTAAPHYVRTLASARITVPTPTARSCCTVRLLAIRTTAAIRTPLRHMSRTGRISWRGVTSQLATRSPVITTSTSRVVPHGRVDAVRVAARDTWWAISFGCLSHGRRSTGPCSRPGLLMPTPRKSGCWINRSNVEAAAARPHRHSS